MLRNLFAIPFALMATAAFSEGEILWYPTQAVGTENLDYNFSPTLGMGAIKGLVVNAGFVDDENNPIGINGMVGTLDDQELHQTWGGIMLDAPYDCKDSYYNYDVVRIFHKENVIICGQEFDLTSESGLSAFNEIRRETKERTFISQLPLVIRDGALDLREIENAPKAIRRLAFSSGGVEGSIGIYQTSEPMTLYEAAKSLLAHESDYYSHEPFMAVNLPMGDHDFCMTWATGKVQLEACGVNEITPQSYLWFEDWPT